MDFINVFMASTFWYLEDGRGFARRWTGMFYMLKLINNEIRTLKGAEAFAEYLDYYIWDEEADEYAPVFQNLF